MVFIAQLATVLCDSLHGKRFYKQFMKPSYTIRRNQYTQINNCVLFAYFYAEAVRNERILTDLYTDTPSFFNDFVRSLPGSTWLPYNDEQNFNFLILLRSNSVASHRRVSSKAKCRADARWCVSRRMDATRSALCERGFTVLPGKRAISRTTGNILVSGHVH